MVAGKALPRAVRSLAEDLIPIRESPGSVNQKHVVIVMDGLKEFSMEPLEWALKNIIPAGGMVTLLGIMPWLNIPLSSKVDFWRAEFEDLPLVRENSMRNPDDKYQKLQAVLDLCNKHGVVPQKSVAMGFPLRLLVVEQIASLHATCVVLDRHQKKHIEFYAKKISCNLVMMNEDGEVDMIKGRCMVDNGYMSTPGESPASTVPTPQLMISEQLRGLIHKDRAPEKHDRV